MIVEILKTDKSLSLRKGHIYKAKRYRFDPNGKVTLLQRLTKKDRRSIGKNPGCNQYLHDVKIIK